MRFGLGKRWRVRWWGLGAVWVLAGLWVCSPGLVQAQVRGTIAGPGHATFPIAIVPPQGGGLDGLGQAFAETLAPCRWCVREKPDWLGPARRARGESFSTDDAVRRFRGEGLRRPQLWSRLQDWGDGTWFEDSRLFVVPDSWRAGL